MKGFEMQGFERQGFELSENMLLEVIKALLADELKTLRPETAQDIFSEDWDQHTSIHPLPADAEQVSLQADSLEKLALATRVTDFFQLRESGLEDYLLRYKTLGQWVELVAEARKRGTQNLTFYTSGSTGQPKPCPQNWQSLVAEADYFRQIFTQRLQQPIQRILALSPCQHIYGFLFSALLPNLLQVPVIRGTRAFSLVQSRNLQAGDLVIGFPFIWKQISRSQQAFPAGVAGITSTGPCDPQVIQQLHQQGLNPLVEIYGSSETGGLGWREQTEQPFQLLPRWQAVEGRDDALLDLASHQQQPLNDQLQWQDARHFYPAGRLDQAVQVAGTNVFPARIAEQLRQLPEVQNVEVRLMSPEEGERLKAFVIPADPQQSESELRQQLQAWCQKNLKTAERPQAFTFGAQLPCNALGKASDWPLQTSNLTPTE
ncbi:MAG: AMP-binding protein [Marinospirillum sp.]|uniref:AMP-binding protein n=1 Tax=Marinospirillum sp. TaxID=2183934 RepID=UPI0019F248EB|nr:AMP-binding protein [Marinospirillum sp.]MBE0505163.1 AMP-binding protein [Marinospirillum sp.]